MQPGEVNTQVVPPVHFRHAVFSPANINKAYRDAFAVIADKMLEVERADDPELAWKEVERYMAIAAFVLDSAATTLMEVDILAKDVSSDESRYNS